MTRILDTDGPPEIIAAANRYTTAISTATGQVRATDLVPGSTGSSPLDVYGTSARRTAKTLLKSATDKTDRRIEPIEVHTPSAANAYGRTDEGGAAAIGRYRSV